MILLLSVYQNYQLFLKNKKNGKSIDHFFFTKIGVLAKPQFFERSLLPTSLGLILPKSVFKCSVLPYF